MFELFVSGVEELQDLEIQIERFDEKTVSGKIIVYPVPPTEFTIEAVLDELLIGKSIPQRVTLVKNKNSFTEGIYKFHIDFQFSVGGNYDFISAISEIPIKLENAAPEVKELSDRSHTRQIEVSEAKTIDAPVIQGHVDRISRVDADGWVWSPEQANESLCVEAILDGRIIGQAVATKMRADLINANIGTGKYGFTLQFDQPLPNNVYPQIRASLNGHVLGFVPGGEADGASLIEINDANGNFSAQKAQVEGHIDRLTRWEARGWAWLPNQPEACVQIQAMLDERVIGQVFASEMREDLAKGGKGTGKYGFTMEFEKPIYGDIAPEFRILTPHPDPLSGAILLPPITETESKFRPKGTIELLFEEHQKFTSKGPQFENFDENIFKKAQSKTDVTIPSIIAFYLPQFHAIPENDAFWGTGFTEWRQLPRAHTRFPGHYQPRIPSDLGFYALDAADAIRRQATLAKKAGIEAFAFYYYWFNTKRVLEKPLEILLNSEIEMPFMLIWANENWTRTWDGSESQVLLKQDYKIDDEDALIDDWIRHFKDSRYVQIDGRPLFVIYNPRNVPDPVETFARWRDKIHTRYGVNPLIFMAQTFGDNDPTLYKLDGALEFPPHKLSNHLPGRKTPDAYLNTFSGRVIQYDDFVSASLNESATSFPLIKTIVPSWDNDARRPGRGLTLEGLCPQKYQKWLQALLYRAAERPILGKAVVAVNAWNEWAESAYLEPDVYYGSSYLNSTARALSNFTRVAKDQIVSQLESQDLPKVSAILPNYNHARYIAQRLYSVINQSLKPSEIIFLDDCSTDDSVEIAIEILSSCGIPYQIVKNDKNSGTVFRQWLKGISLAKFDIIWIAETDDYADLEFIHNLLPTFRHQDVMAAFGRIQSVDIEGNEIPDLERYFSESHNCSWDYPFFLTAYRAFCHDFVVQNIIPNASALLFRKPILSEQEKNRLCEYKFAGDWYFYSKILRGGRLYYSAKAKSYFRMHKDSTSRSAFHTEKHVNEHCMVINDICAEYEPPPASISAHRDALIKHAHVSDADVISSRIYDATVSRSKNALRICIAAHSFAVGGGEILPVELANELKSRGCHITYLVFEREDKSIVSLRKRLRDDIPVVYWSQIEHDIFGFISEYGIEIFNSHNVSIDYHLHLKGIECGCKYISSLHGGYETVPNLLDAGFVDFLNKNIDLWLPLADKNREVLVNAGVSSQNFITSFNALPTPSEWEHRDQFIIDNKLPQDATIIVQASRAINAKNWQISIDAVQNARRRLDKEIVIIFFGDGPDFEEIKTRNIGKDFVRFMGFVEKPSRYFKCCDFGIFPSTFSGETFPLFLLECFQAGLPVIATDVGEIWRMVKGGKNGAAGIVLSAKEDHDLFVADVCNAIEQMLLHNHIYSEMQTGACRRSEDFSIEKLGELYFSQFYNLLYSANM